MYVSEVFCEYSDHFCFYCAQNVAEPLKNNRVVRQYKKDIASFKKLEGFVNSFESKDFKDSLDDFIRLHRIVRLRHVGFNLAELRFSNPSWRILSYLDQDNEMIIMIDAFIAHKTNRDSEVTILAKRRKNEILNIERELRKGFQNGC